MADRDTAATRGAVARRAQRRSEECLSEVAHRASATCVSCGTPTCSSRCRRSGAPTRPDDPRARRDATGDPELKSFVSLVGNVLGALTNLVSDKESAAELRSLSGDAAFLDRRAQALRGGAASGRRDRPRGARGSSRDHRRAQSRVAGRVRLSARRDETRRRAARREHRIAARLVGAAASAHRRRLHRVVRAAGRA